jgi:hypothetical protein
MSPEASGYRERWETYLISNSLDRNFYKSMSLREDDFFMNCYVQKAHHTNLDDFSFFRVYQSQEEYLIYKYINPP